jgi:hypothetical protein
MSDITRKALPPQHPILVQAKESLPLPKRKHRSQKMSWRSHLGLRQPAAAYGPGSVLPAK